MTATRPQSYLPGDTGVWNGQPVTITDRAVHRVAPRSRRRYALLTFRFPDGSTLSETEGRFRAAQPKAKSEPAPRRWNVRDMARWEIRTVVETVRQAIPGSFRPGIGYEYRDADVATATIVGPDGQEIEAGGPDPIDSHQTYSPCYTLERDGLFGRTFTPAAFAELDRRVGEAIRRAIS